MTPTGIASQVRRLLRALTGIHVYSRLPRGLDLAYDIRSHLKRCRIDVVFDIGANVGQSALHYLSWFPEARIYCFEPAADTFRQLEQAVGNRERVECFRLAFSSSPGRGRIVHGSFDFGGDVLVGGSVTRFLLTLSNAPGVHNKDRMEDVSIDTVDAFCRRQRIDRIGFLKIDTEGGDLEVLKGAARMLDRRSIDIVQVEAGMNKGNATHVSFEALKEFLEARQYYLFGMYDQAGEQRLRRPYLRRANPVFISESVIEANAY